MLLPRLKALGEALGEKLYRRRGVWLFIPVTVLLVSRLLSSAPWRAEGLALLAVALALRFWAGAHVGAHTNGSRPEGPSLSVTGPYAHTRHPLYLANGIAAWALALSANCLSWPGMAALLLGVSAFFAALALAEERELASLHGEAFRRYRDRVPALGWRFRRQAETEIMKRSDWPASLRRQGRNALYALALWFLFWLAALRGPAFRHPPFPAAPAPIQAGAPSP